MTLVDLLVVATLIAVVPVAIDARVQRRASPRSLAVLALVALGGLALVPLTVVACLATIATGHGGAAWPSRLGLGVAAIVVAMTIASRVMLAAHQARREAQRILSAARACGTPFQAGSILVPLAQPAAFVADDTAVISTGILDHLEPPAVAAVLAHERAHIAGRHGRLAVVAHALRAGLFGLPLARRAEKRLRQELEVLADTAASRQLDDPASLATALRSLTTQTQPPDSSAILAAGHPPIEDRIARLGHAHRYDRAAQRLVNAGIPVAGTLALGAVCLALHMQLLWLGLALCATILLIFSRLTSSLLRQHC